jgi:hypothetical protein
MGYFVPLEVELSQYYENDKGQKKRQPVTDLDVLGIAYDELLSAKRIVGDCKSGKESETNRLFWLRGVSDYFGANEAYLVKSNVNVHARAIAPKLGLRILSETELGLLEKRFGVDKMVVPIADVDLHNQRQALTVSDESDDTAVKKLASHLRYGFWYFDQHRNIFQIISLCADAAHLLTPSNARHKLLAYICLERFAQTMLDLGAHVLSRDLTNIAKSARVYLFGGPLSLRDRESFIDTLNQLTNTEQNLDPEYMPFLLDLLTRLFQAPRGTSKCLHYIDTCYLWCVSAGKPALASAYPGQYDVSATVAARDICITLCKASGLSESLFEELLRQ